MIRDTMTRAVATEDARLIPINNHSRSPESEDSDGFFVSPDDVARKVGWGLAILIAVIVVTRLFSSAGEKRPPKVTAENRAAPAETERENAWLNSNPVLESATHSSEVAEAETEASPFPASPSLPDDLPKGDGPPMTPPTDSPTPNPPTESKPDLKSLQPFAGFAKAVELPPPTHRDESPLGPVDLPEHLDCVLYLLGGEAAARTRHVYDAELIPDGEVGRAWRLTVREKGSEQPAETLATVAVHDKQLFFRWEPTAAEHPASKTLRNCMLKMSAGPSTLRFALRKELTAAALPVIFDQQTEVWEVSDPPASDQVNVELDVAVPPGMPPARFLGPAVITARSGETFLELGADRVLKLHIKTRLDSDSFDITVAPWFQVAGQPRPLALTPANFKRASATATGPAKAQLQRLLAAQQQFANQTRITVRVSLPVAESRVDLVTAK